MAGITNEERARRAKAREKADRVHVRRVVRVYGITAEDYLRMVIEQDGRCAICLQMPGRRRLVTDHDHYTGRVRALLCTRCNQAIGRFEWDAHVATNAATYLLGIAEDHERTRDATDAAPAP